MIAGLDQAIYSPEWEKLGNKTFYTDICPSQEILLTSIALSLNRIAVESESIATSLMNISINMEPLGE
jgi:hypothetical protein